MITRHSRLPRLAAAAACTLSLTAGGVAAATASASAAEDATTATTARPVMKVPFTCGKTWRGATYSGHNPYYSIDFNQGSGDDDFGRPIKASASGTVKAVRDYGTGPGYGKTVEIRHGGGWTSFYAHLKAGSIEVREGQSVTPRTVIARVGKSGSQSSAHLHYEQRLNGNDQPIKFGNLSVVYFSTRYYTRTC